MGRHCCEIRCSDGRGQAALLCEDERGGGQGGTAAAAIPITMNGRDTEGRRGCEQSTVGVASMVGHGEHGSCTTSIAVEQIA